MAKPSDLKTELPVLVRSVNSITILVCHVNARQKGMRYAFHGRGNLKNTHRQNAERNIQALDGYAHTQTESFCQFPRHAVFPVEIDSERLP